MIGFYPQVKLRTPYHCSQGQKIGYILHKDGLDYAQRNDGSIIARIIRYKKGYVRYPEVSVNGQQMQFYYGDLLR